MSRIRSHAYAKRLCREPAPEPLHSDLGADPFPVGVPPEQCGEPDRGHYWPSPLEEHS